MFTLATMDNKSVVIIGAGLAGLTCAIHLSRHGIPVTIIEKNHFPKHKVCGEYISNEVLPYLKWLDADPQVLNPTVIDLLVFSSANGKSIKNSLQLGGFGISRFALDKYLYDKAIANGCELINASVSAIKFSSGEFSIQNADGTTIKSQICIGAFGKRSNMDQSLERPFISKKSPWLAVKAHYKGNFPTDTVGLYHFDGGYCGVSKVEDNKLNICYLADYKTFKRFKSIAEFEEQVLFQNPNLKLILNDATMLFEKPLTISQISFDSKLPVESHIIMIGDTAGLIHPLCGNGMAMAIHSAKIASEVVLRFLRNETTRDEMEKEYKQVWSFNFKSRLRAGRLLANVLQKPKLTNHLMNLISLFPFILPIIIKQTHGKPIIIND